MTARPIDGAEGYRFYLRNDGNVELDEINEYLRGLGMREVQPRMLAHYQKLDRHGYKSYVTQNRLDLAVAGDVGWLEELHARYAEIARPVPIELRWEAVTTTGQAEAIGLSSATVDVSEVPSAGTPIVLRLVTSGIERTAAVVRSDPTSGRVHLRFDVLGGVEIAPEDAPYLARITVKLAEDSESMPAITDVLFRIERAVARAKGDSDELPRVRALSMTSPLDVLLQSSSPWVFAAGLLAAVPLLRKRWYEGTKAKREAEGIQVDTEAKRRVLQHEVDRKLETEVSKAEAERQRTEELLADEATEADAADLVDAGPDVVEQLRVLGANDAWEHLSRREFFAAVTAAIALPVNFTIEVLDGDQDQSA
jgi:hypothetical protein